MTPVEPNFTVQKPVSLSPGEARESSGPVVEPVVNPNQWIVDDGIVDCCIAQVVELLRAADAELVRSPRKTRRQAARLQLVATQPNIASLTMMLSDEVLRIGNAPLAARRFHDVVTNHSLAGLCMVDRLLLRTGALLAPRLPTLVMALVRRRLRSETAQTILSAEKNALTKHQTSRLKAGFRLNFNRLGEAIVGNDEADLRRRAVIELIERPTTTNVSVKASAIVANLSALSFEDTVARVTDALRTVFASAADRGVFVNVDMEEYRDLRITADAFMSVLSESPLASLDAGIVLQAYIPDSHSVAEELASWAMKRRDAGGGPIRVRLVKGANLAMELVDAEIHGWNPATYPTKADVDSSWKRLLDILLEERLDGALRVGIASHNLFDIAWALHLRSQLVKRGQFDRMGFEMLAGMAESQAVALAKRTGGLLLYTPVVETPDFVAAIGYLTRRLDENTAPENFLSALFDLAPGTPRFTEEANRFRAAVHHRHNVATTSLRASLPAHNDTSFHSEPDSDFTQPGVRAALIEAVKSYRLPNAVPVVGSRAAVDVVVGVARLAQPNWAETSGAERAIILRRVGDHVATHRAEIVSTLAFDASKTISEGDPEVSEAVDFARYYADRAEELGREAFFGPTVQSTPLGVVVVAPPWNFAYAIALGGAAAALAAGNTVIMKPAPQSPRTAQLVVEHCWAAGVPRDVLQLLAVPDNEIGRHLITHRDVDAVILTGGLTTARMFLDWKPSLRLLAETSGKNSLVITATADLDLAIKDLVRSAFGHAGQKCSAASLAIVEASVCDDPAFERRLADAVRTLRCGHVDDPSTDIAPLIEPPSPSLRRAFTTLEPGEKWLVTPVQWDASDDRCWTPGVRTGVVANSWFHTTECFGPVLGVMRADDLDHAIALQNGVAYGLTAGIHSLDSASIDHWKDRIAAGNIYVNRSITGAIVNRQPFGGWKASSLGPTAKAGGPSYVSILRRWTIKAGVSSLGSVTGEIGPCEIESSPPLRQIGIGSVASTNFQQLGSELARLFTAESDPAALISERNTLRYRPLPNGVVLRVGEGADPQSEELAVIAATTTRCPLIVSYHGRESEQQCIEQLAKLRPDRLRIVGSCTDDLRRGAHRLGIRVDEDPVVASARIELTRWSREQSISITMHRHGRLVQ